MKRYHNIAQVAFPFIEPLPVKPPPPTDFSKRARRTDPQTSKDAAKSVEAFGEGHHGVILAALRAHGPATVYEIEARTKIQAHKVGKRMCELEARLLVEQTGDERKSPSGRNCRVWKIS